MTTKQRMNAKVAKLVVGEPVRWSASGIGTVALDNAYQAGHVIMVDTGDENEYWIVRPTDAQRAAAVLNTWGKLTYTMPKAPAAQTFVMPPLDEQNIVDGEFINPFVTADSTQKEDTTMASVHPVVIPPADRADIALHSFIGSTGDQYNDTTEQIADLIACSHHLARRLGLDWKTILADATTLYKSTKESAATTPTVAKSAATNKAPKPKASKGASEAAAVWTLSATLPTGQEITAKRSKPYSHAALIQVDGEWKVFAWVSSQQTAGKRVGDAKRSGIAVTEHKVVEVRIVSAPDASFETDNLIAQERAAEDLLEAGEVKLSMADGVLAGLRDYDRQASDEAAPTWPRTEELPFEPTAADADDEIQREAEIEEPMHVQIKGGTAIHYSDDAEQTYCGIERDDMRQVEIAVTCKSCLKVAASRVAKA